MLLRAMLLRVFLSYQKLSLLLQWFGDDKNYRQVVYLFDAILWISYHILDRQNRHSNVFYIKILHIFDRLETLLQILYMFVDNPLLLYVSSYFFSYFLTP